MEFHEFISEESLERKRAKLSSLFNALGAYPLGEKTPAVNGQKLSAFRSPFSTVEEKTKEAVLMGTPNAQAIMIAKENDNTAFTTDLGKVEINLDDYSFALRQMMSANTPIIVSKLGTSPHEVSEPLKELLNNAQYIVFGTKIFISNKFPELAQGKEALKRHGIEIVLSDFNTDKFEEMIKIPTYEKAAIALAKSLIKTRIGDDIFKKIKANMYKKGYFKSCHTDICGDEDADGIVSSLVDDSAKTIQEHLNEKHFATGDLDKITNILKERLFPATEDDTDEEDAMLFDEQCAVTLLIEGLGIKYERDLIAFLETWNGESFKSEQATSLLCG